MISPWFWTLGIGAPILGVAVWWQRRRIRSSAWWRLLVCICIACIFTPLPVHIGAEGSPVIVPGILWFVFVCTLEREYFWAAFRAGIVPIVLACMVLVGLWSVAVQIRSRARNENA